MKRQFFVIILTLSLMSCDNNSVAPLSIVQQEKIRLVSLAPHISELVATAGALENLVGVVEYSDFPEKVKSIPRIGDAFLIDMESIISLNPDYVLTWKGGTSRSILNQLEKFEIKYVEIDIKTLNDIPNAVLQISNLTKTVNIAKVNVSEYEKFLLKKKAIPKKQHTVFLQISEQPLFTVSGKHWMSEAVSLCGLNNVFSDLVQLSVPVTNEAVISKKPDIILNINKEPTDLWQTWIDSGVLKNTKVITVDPAEITIPSLRLMLGIEKICSSI